MTEPPTPPPDEPPRPPMRMFFALPPWFATATEEERSAPEFKERLTAWFREQRLAREQRQARAQASDPDDPGPTG